MTSIPSLPLSDLYHHDEPAWLEAMATLAAQGRTGEMDHQNLSEFLSDMAKRDRREVVNRLSVLIAHLLKWNLQPDRRTPSWRLTVEVQRQKLTQLLESGTLRRHAEECLPRAYRNGVGQAIAETGLGAESFAEACPFTLDDILLSPLD